MSVLTGLLVGAVFVLLLLAALVAGFVTLDDWIHRDRRR